ncbi:MFS transporter [Salinirubellus salinus]|uniref:MFS transporter n=1 Tax=Salinirubellus salinus TaxID=1364945 RepID=A0A9E7R5Z5_9EURY|nr:MFS transporter [Salinirubellus salinus]UWM56232.1 MFS transporter [Salinirubellus salinus]
MTRRTQWGLVSLAALTRFGSGILMGTVLAIVVERTGSALAAGVLATGYFAGLMLFSPVWGAIADVTGRRRAVMVGTGALATLSILPLTLSDAIGWSILWRAVYSVFAAGFAPVVLAIVSHYGGASGTGRSIGFYNGARSGGFAGGNLVAGVLLGLYLPGDIYLVVGALSLVSTLAALGIEDPTPSPDGDATLREVASEVRHRLLPSVGDRDHLRTNGLAFLYLGLAVRNACILGVMALIAPFLVGTVGLTEATMGAVLAANHGTQVPAMVALGVVADRVGRKPLVVAGMAGSGLFALVVSLAPAVAPDSRVLFAAGAMVVLGVAFSAMTTGALAFISDVAPPNRESELMGLRSTAKGLGGVVGPVLVGGVATLAGYRTAFALASVLAFAAAALVWVALTESRPTGSGEVVPAGD